MVGTDRPLATIAAGYPFVAANRTPLSLASSLLLAKSSRCFCGKVALTDAEVVCHFLLGGTRRAHFRPVPVLTRRTKDSSDLLLHLLAWRPVERPVRNRTHTDHRPRSFATVMAERYKQPLVWRGRPLVRRRTPWVPRIILLSPARPFPRVRSAPA
jgi:hypothetical protein